MEDTAASSILSIWASIHSWFTPTILFFLCNLMIATILFTSNLPNNPKPPNQTDSNSNPNPNPNPPKILRSPSILHRLKSLNLYPHRSEQIPSIHHRQPLEIAATDYVFNQTLPHDEDPQPEQTHEEVQVRSTFCKPAQFADFSHTHQLKPPNAETHFVFEHHAPVETVTNHFDSDPTRLQEPDFDGVEENDELQSLDEVYSKLNGGGVNRTMSDTKPASGEVPEKLPAKMKKSASMKSAFGHFEEEKNVEARRPATVREGKTAARETEEDDVEVDARADDFINKFKHQLKLQRIDSIIRYKDMINRGGEK